MSDSVEKKKLLFEEYLISLGLCPESINLTNEDSYQWLFSFMDSSVFLMIFNEGALSYVWIERALFKEDSYPLKLTLFLLKTQYSYLHPYRLAISDGGFLVVQFISPVNKVCDEDLRLILKDLIGFSEYVAQELSQKFALNSIFFGEGTSTSMEDEK